MTRRSKTPPTARAARRPRPLRNRTRRLERLEPRALLALSSLSVAGDSVLEPIAGQSDLVFTVTRSGDVSAAVAVHARTSDVSAAAGDDYLPFDGELILPPGVASAWLTVPVLADDEIEGVETLRLSLQVVGASPMFLAKQDFGTGDNPLSLAAADINGDGKPDLAAINRDDDNVSVLLNTTSAGSDTASFSPRVDFDAGQLPSAVVAADINRDGKPDLAIGHFASPTVSVLLNTTPPGLAVPTFSPRNNIATGSIPAGIALGDVDGDGAVDLVTTDFANDRVSVFLNSTPAGGATASFGTKIDLATGDGPRSVAIDDVNGDGAGDLVVANLEDDTVSVLLNNTIAGAPGLTFFPKVDFPTGPYPISVATGDVNGDGRPDIAVGNFGVPPARGNTVSVLLNGTPPVTFTPVFSPKQDFATGLSPYSVVLADVTGDGRPDIATANNGFAPELGTTASVLTNTTPTGASSASFAAKLDLATGTNPSSIVAADMNGDGRPDLAVSNQVEDTLSVFLNNVPIVSDPVATGTIVDARVRGRHIFYNTSRFDGNNPAANAADDGAIAPDKTALLPGGTGTFANYTSFTRGINGVMIDLAVPSATPTAANFTFKVGNNNDPASWITAPPPTSIAARPGAGVGGSTRVTLVWPDNIKKQWLQVTVLAGATTGLLANDVFYFGNAVGETGNSTTNALVNAADEALTRLNGRNALNPAPITFPYDFNRDGPVGSSDQAFCRLNATSAFTALVLLRPPVAAAAGPASPGGASLKLAADLAVESLFASLGRSGKRRRA